jgi:hypothetical protein
MNGKGMLEVRYRRPETIIPGRNMGSEKFKKHPGPYMLFSQP